jgi:hypothetical protein
LNLTITSPALWEYDTLDIESLSFAEIIKQYL